MTQPCGSVLMHQRVFDAVSLNKHLMGLHRHAGSSELLKAVNSSYRGFRPLHMLHTVLKTVS